MASSSKPRLCSSRKLLDAGFIYINQENKVRCIFCELEIFEWAHDMDPLLIHAKRSPSCVFIYRQFLLNKFKNSPSLQSSLEAHLFQSNKNNSFYFELFF